MSVKQGIIIRVGKTKSFVLGLVTVMLAAPLAACDDGRSDAEAAAAELAAALASLDVGGIEFAGLESSAANDQLREVFQALDPDKPAVEPGEVTLDADTATVPLNYTWNIEGQEWSYTVSAELTRTDGEWLPRWSADLLVEGLENDEVLAKQTTAAPRAEILGADDVPIVTNRPVVDVGIDKTLLGSSDPAAAAAQLAQLVEVDPAAYSSQVLAAGPEAFVPAITLRSEGRTITDQQISAIPGARSIPGSLPLAPTRTFARALLGTVTEASAEQIEASEGALAAGDVTGTGGLQERYDDRLRGSAGVAIVAKPAADSPNAASGAKPRELFQTPAVPGEPLRITLDPALQQLAEDILSDVGPASAIVALRPSSGAVLAAASGPGSKGYNTAMLGQYAPGSTFKIVDALAMIRNGMTADSQVQCTPTIMVEGRRFKNADGYPESSLGSVTLRDAFAHSCNTAFIAAREQVTQQQLESAAVSLGVAVEAPSLGAAAFLGSVPGEAEGTEHAASMIGQGKVLMSPLAAAVMAGSVAKGAPVSPQLVLNPDASSSGEPSAEDTNAAGDAPAAGSSPTPSGPSSVTPEAPSAASDTPVTAEEAAVLNDLMRAVVTSGHAGFLAAVPGLPVGAKTGTAEFGSDDPPKTHAWIVAVQGDLAVAVFVEEGGLGAEVSGPLLQEFLTAAG